MIGKLLLLSLRDVSRDVNVIVIILVSVTDRKIAKIGNKRFPADQRPGQHRLCLKPNLFYCHSTVPLNGVEI